MPSLILSNPLGSDDAQEIGLTPREYAVGEVITVNDFVFATLIRTGYGVPYGTVEDILLIGDGSPTEAVGVDGQWYLDKLNEVLWGPKTGGYWPADPIRPDRGVQQLRIDENDHLLVTYSTGTVIDLGNVRGPQGPDPDPATSTTRGTVRLGGDLGGTADDPTVPGLADKIDLAEKGAADGVATLGPDGRIPAGQVPAIALSDFLGVVADEAAMLALPGQRGDWATRTDLGADFILIADDPTLAGSWRQITTPGQVTSVDGRTGAVALDDLYVADTEKGAPDGVATLDAAGKVPAAQLPAGGGGGGGSGDDAGGAFVPDVIDPAQPLEVTIVSNWGVTDAGETYYDDVGALPEEAGLLIPDPETGSMAVWRPGAPWNDYLDTRMADRIDQVDSETRKALDDAYGRDRGTGIAFPTTNLRRGDVYYHTGLASLMVYTGLAWRQVCRAEVADLAARTAISTNYAADLHTGFEVLDIATGIEWTWFGAATGGWVALGAWTTIESATNFVWAVPVGGNPGTTMPAIAGGADASFAVTVPKGRTLEVEWNAPLVSVVAGASVVARLAVGSTVLDGIVMTAPAGGGPYLPLKLAGAIRGAGAPLTVVPQAWSITSSCSMNANGAIPQGIRLNYRIV